MCKNDGLFLSLKTGGTSQQSRLTQWKLPALDKDSDLGSGGEFSRAPGTTAKSAPGSSSPNTNLLLGQADGYVITFNLCVKDIFLEGEYTGSAKLA